MSVSVHNFACADVRRQVDSSMCAVHVGRVNVDTVA